ncbi:hypothetical protein IAQ61_011942 [Plenodomus lingam]|uniref:uncharacterized protein n=1 Tax=Leptosphaeria maculans TaxID=5022 RepID=UPI00332EEE0C|nr:hypothetical protein IAQ61_011942 [Plenodomus lingam]
MQRHREYGPLVQAYTLIKSFLDTLPDDTYSRIYSHMTAHEVSLHKPPLHNQYMQHTSIHHEQHTVSTYPTPHPLSANPIDRSPPTLPSQPQPQNKQGRTPPPPPAPSPK